MNRKRSMYTVQCTGRGIAISDEQKEECVRCTVYTVQCTGRGIAISDEQKEECVHCTVYTVQCTVYRPWNRYIR